MNPRLEQARLTNEFRRIYKSIDDLSRRMAATMLNGRVAEIRGDQVRVEILPLDGRTGKKFLSPWVNLQEAAGLSASKMPVKEGDPVRLLSPNGELGSQSLAIRDAYTEDAPSPGGDGEFVLAFGDVSIRAKGGELRLVASSIKAESDTLKHNETNVGDTHRHEDVMAGPDKTGHPEK